MTKEFYTSVVHHGNKILYRGYENGKAVKRRLPFKPTLFMAGNKNSGWTTLEGLPVDPIVFDSMSEAKDFVNRDYGENMLHKPRWEFKRVIKGWTKFTLIIF